MKKKKVSLIVVVLIVGVVVLIIMGKGIGFGKGEGDGNTKVKTTHEENATIENDTIDEEITAQNDNAIDANMGAVIKVSVVGNEYFYENERISLEEFINKVGEIDGDVVVEVKDDNASLKAYNSIINELKGKNINYVEK